MAYTAWSVVFGEQPTAAKWNQLGTNDAGFADGTNIADGAILPKHLLAGAGTSWPWQTYTSTWSSSGTQPVIGNGTITAKYVQIGKTFHVRIAVLFGGTTTFGTGTYLFSLPATSAITSGSHVPIGQWTATGPGGVSLGMCTFNSSTSVIGAIYHGIATAGAAVNVVGQTTPQTWTTTSVMFFNFTYEVA